MEDLIKKIGHRIGEVSDRAVRSLHSKLTTNLTTPDEILNIEGGAIAALLLHWINERQSQADIQTLSCSLKVLLEISQTSKGLELLQDLQAVEFLNAYYKYVPSTLQMTVTSILNCLISPNIKIEARREEYVPVSLGLEYIEKTKVVKVVEENSDKPCEFPPVLLCESDEKILFDATVTVKFGSAEEVINTCSDLSSRVLRDFPGEVFLQHGDLLRSLVNLVKASSQKRLFEVSLSSLSVISSLLRKLQIFSTQIKSAETRPSTVLPKKILAKSEYIDLSVPCLKTEQFEIGTPGPTFSLFYAVEFIMSELPLDCVEILSAVLDVWKEAEWFYSALFKHPAVIQKLLNLISEGISAHSGQADSAIYIEKLIKIAENLILALPIDSISLCLNKDSKIIDQIAEFSLFQPDSQCEVVRYLEKINPDLVCEFRYAQVCVKSIEALKSMNQILLNQEVLPISTLPGFYKALDFFSNIFPALEFFKNSNVISAILDLNCYSIYISSNSTSEARQNDCENLILNLLASTLPAIPALTLSKIEEILSAESSLVGIAQGLKRKILLKEVLLRPSILGLIVIKHRSSSVIQKLMQDPEDYEKLIPFFTIIQSFNEDSLEGILHMISICNPSLHPLRYFRDLFSASDSRRAIAVTVLKGSNTPEHIQENCRNLVENMWDQSTLADPVKTLAAVPELETLSPVNSNLSQEEMTNLLNIFKSTTLEPNLKVSASEQILLHLVSGFSHEGVIEEILVSSINNLIKDTEDRYAKRLISKSLQILVTIALKYEARAKKLYTSSVKFMCSLLPYIFSSYDQIRHYSLYLLYILSFSAVVQRNRFIPSEQFILVPRSQSQAVPIISDIFYGFLQPFPTSPLDCDLHPDSEYVKIWKNVPSSNRVKSFINRVNKLQIDVDRLLDVWGKNLSQAETHKAIISICYEWLSYLKVAIFLSGTLDYKLVQPNSDLISSILSVLRSPPVNLAEDQLHISLQQILRNALSFLSSNKVHLEFIQTVSSVVSRSSIPFISELTEIITRKPLILSILSVFQTLIPFHGAVLEGGRTLFILSKHQLEPGPLSFLALLNRIASSIDDISLLESVLKTIIQVLDHPQLEVSADISTSPVSQNYIKETIRISVAKISPYINPSTFLYKSAAKQLVQLLSRVPHLADLDSYMWLIRFAEDRDQGLRTLAWGALSLKSIDSYSLHSSVLDIALEVVFGLPESFGVKIQACRFLCSLTGFLLDSEDSVHKAGIMKTLYQYAVISHIKTMIFENAGPPPVYFSVLLGLLNNLVVLDSGKVIPICIQIDVWEGVIRILRPGAFEERCKNESRKPLKGLESSENEQVLLGVISICTFFNNIIRNEIQVLDYLLETSHFVGFLISWVDVMLEKFDQKNEKICSKALLGVINVLHLSLFKSHKTKQHLTQFSYEKLAKILEMTQSADLKISIARFLSSLLAAIPSSDCEKIILHLVSLFKSTDVISDHREILKSLTSLLYHDENSKIIAIQTGFPEVLLSLSQKLLSQIQSIDVQKSKKIKEDDQPVKQLIDYLVLFKLWASNSNQAKQLLSLKDGRLGPMLKLLFISWSTALRKEDLLKVLLESICTIISGCEEAKKACAIVQENRQSILSQIIEYISRPNSTTETCFHISLQIIGSLCSCKESRQLLIKSKYPQGLALRLINEWNEMKNIEEVPKKLGFVIEFLACFSFFAEGQKVMSSITGLVTVIVEVLDLYVKGGFGNENVEHSLLLLRNLAFDKGNKPHLIASQKTLTIILSYISTPSQKPRLRKLASAALWALLYHCQKFKGILAKEQVLSELEEVYKEVCRDAERAKDKEVADDLRGVGENLNSVLKICTGC